MSDLKQIGIDLEVNRVIESNRRSFDESENDILRRVLLPDREGSVPRQDLRDQPMRDEVRSSSMLLRQAREARVAGPSSLSGSFMRSRI